MSSIPPNWMSSVVGGVQASGKASEAKSKADADQAKAMDTSSFAEKLDKVIESDDVDSQVHTDAEGRGSMGRSFSEGDEEEHAEENNEETSADSGGGLDLEA